MSLVTLAICGFRSSRLNRRKVYLHITYEILPKPCRMRGLPMPRLAACGAPDHTHLRPRTSPVWLARDAIHPPGDAVLAGCHDDRRTGRGAGRRAHDIDAQSR